MARDPGEVFGRLMALRALLWRTQFELHLSQKGAPRSDIEARNAELTSWMQAATIPFSTREREQIARPLGSWVHDEIAELVWRNEAAAALLWVLDLVPTMPPYFVTIPAPAVMERIEQLPLLADPPPMRPAAEIATGVELASLWHWRARTEALRLSGVQPPAGDTFDATIERATRFAVESKLVEPSGVIDGDLVVGTGPGALYAAAPPEIQRQLACIAHERHWALTWLSSDERIDWDQVHPST